MKKVLERISGHASYDLPLSFSREIGRIIVRWAYFEQCVQEMVWQALNLTAAAGRIALREPRVTDRLEMLRDVIKLRGGSWDEQLYKSIYTRANLLHAKRNLVGHGMWFHHKAAGEWHVQLTRGSWPKDTADLIAGSKKVNPESILITIGELRSATMELSALIDDLKKLRASAIGGQSPSPHKYP